MAEYSRVQVIELFHVAFLDALSHRLDQTRYILKGGANLRYFFKSLRYSEDMDLDCNGVESWRLEDKVDDVLSSKALGALLRASDSAVADFTKPKQTQTTQRWKIAIEAPGHKDPVRTKIEFSNRNGDERYRLDPVPSAVVTPYALRAPSVQHYIDDAPSEQKVKALAGRPETQARDVFDLDLLLRQRPLPSGVLPAETIDQAIEIALGINYATYSDQVLPYLEAEAVELYGSEAAWEQMQTYVAEKLEEAK